jgi:hypothetical protein
MEIQIEVSRVQVGWVTVDIGAQVAEASADTVELVGRAIVGTFTLDADDIIADTDEDEVDWDTTDGMTAESVMS